MLELGFYAFYRAYLLPRADGQRRRRRQRRGGEDDGDGDAAEEEGEENAAEPYRDFPLPSDRVNLMIKIMDRIDRSARRRARGGGGGGGGGGKADGNVLANEEEEKEGGGEEGGGHSGDDLDGDDDDIAREALAAFIRGWFWVPTGEGTVEDLLLRTLSSSGGDPRAAAPLLPRQGDMDSFLSWAFFAKYRSDLSPPETLALEDMCRVMSDRLGVGSGGIGQGEGRPFANMDTTAAAATTPGLEPMRLTLDPVGATHRPLGVYLFFLTLNVLGRAVLSACGFRRYQAGGGGLTYWHRPAGTGGKGARMTTNEATEGTSHPPPLLFFHGIAPGGLTLYLPMLLRGPWGRDGRAMILFENPPISFSLAFEAVDEERTCRGVREAMDLHLEGEEGLNGGGGVTVLGHSFGTFQVSWVLRSALTRDRIRQVTVIDPVSILLSEPDVVTNFVYSRPRGGRGLGSGSGPPGLHAATAAMKATTTAAATATLRVWNAVRPVFLFPLYYALRLLTSPAVLDRAPRMSREYLRRLSSTATSSAWWSSSSSSSFSSLSSSPPPPSTATLYPIPRSVSGTDIESESESESESWVGKKKKKNRNNICMVQSELFIEHYLRRNFAWYNSELFLDDLPCNVRALVCISGRDEILDADKVWDEARAYRAPPSAPSRPRSRSPEKEGSGGAVVEAMRWEGAGHAHCVPRPRVWEEIGRAMSGQEG